MAVIFETKPPNFRGDYTKDDKARRLLAQATNFHNSYGSLPSIRCRNLAADLKRLGEQISPEDLAAKYQFNKDNVKKAVGGPAKITAQILERDIAPVYNSCEKDFTEKIKESYGRVKKALPPFEEFISRSEGTPFVALVRDAVHPGEFLLRPTSDTLIRKWLKHRRKTGEWRAIALVRFQTDKDKAVLLNLQRPRFRDADNFRTTIVQQYGILEQLFLLSIAFINIKNVYIPASRFIFEYWKKRHQTEADLMPQGLHVHETEFGIYDKLGVKYGKRVDVLPQTPELEAMENFLLGGKQHFPGWKIELR